VLFREHIYYFSNIFGISGQNSFGDFLYTHASELCRQRYMSVSGENDCPMEIDTLIRFYNRGCVYMAKQFVFGNIRMEPEELADLLYESMPEKLRLYIGREGAAVPLRKNAAVFASNVCFAVDTAVSEQGYGLRREV
jgi:hypothetical protein